MTSYQCRSCKTVLDGMGIVCTGCGIPVRFADEQKRDCEFHDPQEKP